MMSERTDMTTKTRSSTTTGIIETLNRRLADTLDLASQLKQAHWNVTGENFIAIHRLFDEQAALVRDYADELAERARALEAPARGTVRVVAESSTLDEFPSDLIEASKAIRLLLKRYESVSDALNTAAQEASSEDDSATEDLYIEGIRAIDQAAYFLRAHLGTERSR
jgi:starvation-inducible DNA-binding protein